MENITRQLEQLPFFSHLSPSEQEEITQKFRRVGKNVSQNLIDDREAASVASANAEDYEIFHLRARIDDLDVFAFRFELHHIFRLRKKHIFGGFYGF